MAKALFCLSHFDQFYITNHEYITNHAVVTHQDILKGLIQFPVQQLNYFIWGKNSTN